jgi:poly(hydroxyalkanoate) granule-associated protein
MAKPTPSPSQSTPIDAAPGSVQPAQHIWLAGLGAMAKAQEEGTKAIEALVNDGLAFQRKSQAEAQKRLHEATEQLSHMASGLGQQTSGRVDRLEHLFEDRVAKALHRLGIPTLQDMQALNDRLTHLEAWVQSQSPQPPAVTPSAKSAPKSSASRQRQATPPADPSGTALTTPIDKSARPAPKPPSKPPRHSARVPK